MSVHPTSILEGNVTLGDNVTIGPNCVITGDVTIGSDCTLIGNVYINGPLTMGESNVVYPFACLGFAPQHAKFDPAEAGRGVVIGSHNTFRESATAHRAFADEHPTTIGDHNLFMVNAHAGHDCMVGNHCTLVNNVALGGHVVVEDRVTIGGGTVIHQFVRIGRGAMLGGVSGITLNLPPFFLVTEVNLAAGVNIVGMRRMGMSHAEIDDVRFAYRTLCRRGLRLNSAVEVLKERADRPLIAEYIRFIESSDRPICTARGRRQGG